MRFAPRGRRREMNLAIAPLAHNFAQQIRNHISFRIVAVGLAAFESLSPGLIGDIESKGQQCIGDEVFCP